MYVAIEISWDFKTVLMNEPKKKKKKLNKQGERLKLEDNHMTESFMKQRFLLPQQQPVTMARLVA